MNYNKLIATTLIKLILVMPFYSAMVFAQPEQGQGPSIDITLPRYYNRREIDITGRVTPYSIVQLYVDSQLERMLSSTETDDGEFEFYNIQLGGHGTTKAIRITARDQAGDANTKDFLITVDMEKPEVSLKDVPEHASKKDLTITGFVNEDATINIYVLPVTIDTTRPAKIQGLNNKSVRPSLVEVEWYESNETDFDRYIIYRDDVGAIATTSPADYNSYSDALVNSNESYTYSVSAMDRAGNIGESSDEVMITIPPGGRADLEKPKEIDPSKDRGLQRTITAAGNFSFDIELGDDGLYNIRAEAIDAAGNKRTAESQTFLDTRPPTLEEINPPGGTRIYESYAKEIDIGGKTKPYAKVKIYINELKGSEDFSTIADSTGQFKFDDVNLRRYFKGSIVPERVGVGELESRYDVVEEERGRHARTVTLYFIAEDMFGRTANATIVYNIVTCWEGKFDWDAMPLLAYQSPTWLSVERLSEGTEAIYFFFNFTYLGDGLEPKIDSINFQKACDDYIMRDPRYNVSCQVLPSSCTAKPNDDKTMWYVACELGMYDGFNNFLEGDWEDFFKAINNEMIFPFRVMLRYNHIKGNNRTSEYQTFCKPVTYVVDSSKVDFRDVLPDWLLYDAVDAINKTVSTLNEWQESIEEVLKYLGMGCMIAFGLRTVGAIYRRFVCFWDSFQSKLEKLAAQSGEGEEDAEDEEEEKPCPETEEERNKLSDKDLKDACEQCGSAWEFEEKMYMAYRVLCDRVFCHDSPARWTQDQPDTDLYEKAIEEVSRCAADDRGVKGQTLTPTDCSSWGDALDKNTIENNNAGDECYQARVIIGKVPDIIVFVKEKDSEYENTGIHHFTSVSRKAPRAAEMRKVEFYAKEVKGSLKNSYYTANTKTCEEVCGNSEQKLCISSKDCLALNAPESEEKEKQIKEFNNKWKPKKRLDPGQKYSSKRSGYTRDCVFGNGKTETDGENKMDYEPDTNFPGDTLENTKECCCVYKSERPPTNFYAKDDYGIEIDKGGEGTKGTGFPEWSYRYNKIKFATGPEEDGKPKNRDHTSYHPDRYIAERDFAGCFGMNYLFDLKGGSKLKLDPFKDHIATFQCLCVSGIHNRLQLISNILTAMQNCLITVRTTGTADSGVCEELFSQYVCSLVWYIISFLQTGCLPWGGKGKDLSESNNQILGAVRGGVGALFGGLAESAADLGSDYGNAQLNNLIGVGEGAIVRKICMAAFGFDWDLDIEDLLDVAYSTPMATLVQAIMPRREYLTYDPTNGQSKYEYRGSWIINPGCDMDNYNVHLSCVSRNEKDKYPGIDCDSVNDPEGINCDCLNLDGEKTKPFYDGGELTQNVLEDTNHHDIITSMYRFDHLKFVLRTDQEIPQKTKEKCFPEGHENGIFYFPIGDHTATDVLSCYVDITTGQFNCLAGLPFFKAKGTGYFIDLKLNNKDAEDVVRDGLKVGEKLTLTPTVWRAEGPDLCLYTEWVQERGKKTDRVLPVEMSGTREYPPVIIDNEADIVGLTFYNIVGSTTPQNGKISPESLRPEPEASFTPGETMSVTFFDKAKSNGTEVADGEITINRKSNDMVQITGQEKFAIGESDYWKGDKFILTKGGMVFEVKAVTLPTITTAKGTEKASQVMFTIKTVSSGVAAQQVTKTLRVSLVHLKGDNSTRYVSPENCNIADKVSYQGKVQQEEYRITIGTGAEGACPGDSTKSVSNCKCAKGITHNDCGLPGSDLKYCYKGTKDTDRVCRGYPTCPEKISDLTTKIACDCDGDGTIKGETDPAKIKEEKLCEGGAETYCWDKNNDTVRECINESKPKPVTPAAPIEFKIGDKVKLKTDGRRGTIESKRGDLFVVKMDDGAKVDAAPELLEKIEPGAAAPTTKIGFLYNDSSDWYATARTGEDKKLREKRVFDPNNKKVTVERYYNGKHFLTMTFTDTDLKQVEAAYVAGGTEWWGPEALRSADKIKITEGKRDKDHLGKEIETISSYISPLKWLAGHLKLSEEIIVKKGLPNLGEKPEEYKKRIGE